MNCEVSGCNRMARYALFQLTTDFTKRWLCVCPVHDNIIAHQNKNLLMFFPGNKFKEVKK